MSSIPKPHTLRGTSGFGRSYIAPTPPRSARRSLRPDSAHLKRAGPSTLQKIASQVKEHEAAFAARSGSPMRPHQFRSLLRQSGVDLNTLAIDRAVTLAQTEDGSCDVGKFLGTVHAIESPPVIEEGPVPDRLLYDGPTIRRRGVDKDIVLGKLRERLYTRGGHLADAFSRFDLAGDHRVTASEMESKISDLVGARTEEEHVAVRDLVQSMATSDGDMSYVHYKNFSRIMDQPELPASPTKATQPPRTVSPERVQLVREPSHLPTTPTVDEWHGSRPSILMQRYQHRELTEELLDLSNQRPQKLVSAFQTLDHQGGGVVNEESFRASLQSLGVRDPARHVQLARKCARKDGEGLDYAKYLIEIGCHPGSITPAPAQPAIPRAKLDHGNLQAPEPVTTTPKPHVGPEDMIGPGLEIRRDTMEERTIQTTRPDRPDSVAQVLLYEVPPVAPSPSQPSRPASANYKKSGEFMQWIGQPERPPVTPRKAFMTSSIQSVISGPVERPQSARKASPYRPQDHFKLY